MYFHITINLLSQMIKHSLIPRDILNPFEHQHNSSSVYFRWVTAYTLYMFNQRSSNDFSQRGPFCYQNPLHSWGPLRSGWVKWRGGDGLLLEWLQAVKPQISLSRPSHARRRRNVIQHFILRKLYSLQTALVDSAKLDGGNDRGLLV